MKVILNELPPAFETWTLFYSEVINKMYPEEIFEKGFVYQHLGPEWIKGDEYHIKPDFLKQKLLEELTQSLTTNKIVGYHFSSIDAKFAEVLYCTNGEYYTAPIGIYLMTEEAKKRFLKFCGKQMGLYDMEVLLNKFVNKINQKS